MLALTALIEDHTWSEVRNRMVSERAYEGKSGRDCRKTIVVMAIRSQYISEEAQIVVFNGFICKGKSSSKPDSRFYFLLSLLASTSSGGKLCVSLPEAGVEGSSRKNAHQSDADNTDIVHLEVKSVTSYEGYS